LLGKKGYVVVVVVVEVEWLFGPNSLFWFCLFDRIANIIFVIGTYE